MTDLFLPWDDYRDNARVGHGFARSLSKAHLGTTRRAVESYYRAADTSVGDFTAAVRRAYEDAPLGAELWFPKGATNLDPIALTNLSKTLHLRGDADVGRWNSWVVPNRDINGPVVGLQAAVDSGHGARDTFGPSVRGLGFDLTGAPSATAIQFAGFTQHGLVRDVYTQGGAISISNLTGNNYVQDCFLTDAGIFISANGGNELRVRDTVMARNSFGTTTAIIQIISPTGGGGGGALYLSNCQQTRNPVSGVNVSQGVVMTAPSNKSMPLIATQCDFDNIQGPALVLTNVSDHRVVGCWFNAAAGSNNPAVKITGGGNMKFIGNDYFGGLGAGASTYEFMGGATAGFVSIGNRCPTGPIYRLSGSAAADDPIEMVLLDQAGAANLSNLPIRLANACAADYSRNPWVLTALGAGGDATLGSGGTPGQVFVPNTRVNAAASRFRLDRRTLGGTAGFLYVVNVTTGVGFTIASTNTADTSLISWEHYLLG